jgi:hypothetical protein
MDGNSTLNNNQYYYASEDAGGQQQQEEHKEYSHPADNDILAAGEQRLAEYRAGIENSLTEDLDTIFSYLDQDGIEHELGMAHFLLTGRNINEDDMAEVENDIKNNGDICRTIFYEAKKYFEDTPEDILADKTKMREIIMHMAKDFKKIYG